MASQVQYRRGTNAQNAAFTGALAEITVDTTNGTLRVHDAITVGGSNIATVAYVTAQISALSANSISSGNSNVSVLSAAGNVAVNVGGSGIITFTSAGIINNMGNGVGNIGNSTGLFNTVFAKATSAQYADLAEKYTADADYVPGTVLDFNGAQEVTLSTRDSSKRVAGVVSTNPAHLMNSTLDGAHVVAVALVGRVPTQVTGTIAKGDLMVSAGNGRARAEANPAIGTVIGKALENFSGGEGTIEIVISMQ